MDFYRTLAEYYDEIFPLKGPQKNFLHEYLRQEGLASVLDIGCGTGTFALEMSQADVRVLGVDLSDEMIEISQKKAEQMGSTASFSRANMLDLSSIKEQFDGIVCLGNTMAHVSGALELHQALTQFRSKGSHLLLQIVNYDRIIAQQIRELPLIKTQNLVFSRFYAQQPDGKIEFTMKLEFPATQQVVTGANLLFPLTVDLLKDALLATGWEVSDLWGSFAQEPWTEDSPATVLAAKRKPSLLS